MQQAAPSSADDRRPAERRPIDEAEDDEMAQPAGPRRGNRKQHRDLDDITKVRDETGIRVQESFEEFLEK